VRRFDRDVLRLALNLMKRPEDARDVYQEAFLKVYRICTASDSNAVFIPGCTAL